MKPDKLYEVISSGYNRKPDYVTSMITPVRKFYPTEEIRENEILKMLTEKVKTKIRLYYLKPKLDIQDATKQKHSITYPSTYNAFEMDIAVLNIYFGKSSVTGDTISYY